MQKRYPKKFRYRFFLNEWRMSKNAGGEYSAVRSYNTPGTVHHALSTNMQTKETHSSSRSPGCGL
jgi:hypothetical protein